jgi:hypothetical protein
MRIMEKSLFSLIPLRDISEKVSKTKHRYYPRKIDGQFSAAANFGELKQLPLKGRTYDALQGSLVLSS